MASKRDLRIGPGMICVLAVGAVQASVLFRALTSIWGDVEVWAVENVPKDEFNYFWLVSLKDGVVRELACVRFSCRREVLQERIQGPFGQVFWERVEAEPGGPKTVPGKPVRRQP